MKSEGNFLHFAFTQSIVSNLDVCSASSYFVSQTPTLMSVERCDIVFQFESERVSLTKQLLHTVIESKLRNACLCHSIRLLSKVIFVHFTNQKPRL